MSRRRNRNVVDQRYAVLYHVTPVQNVSSIIALGLDPERSLEPKRFGSKHGAVYLSAELDSAMSLLRALLRMVSFDEKDDVVAFFIDLGVDPDEAEDARAQFEEKMETRKGRARLIQNEDSPDGLYFHMQMYFHPAGPEIYNTKADLPFEEFLWGRPAQNFYGKDPATILFVLDMRGYEEAVYSLYDSLMSNGERTEAYRLHERFKGNIRSINTWKASPGGIEAGVSLEYPQEMDRNVVTPVSVALTPEGIEKQAEFVGRDLEGYRLKAIVEYEEL
jgi:hypothetical protein